MIRTLRDEYTWWGPFGKDCRHPQSPIQSFSSDVTSPDTETRLPQRQISKALMDGGRLATSVKPLQSFMSRDCRHGKKQWLLLADDDDTGFSTTAVDTVDSSSLLDEDDPAAINDDDVSSPVVSCCSPNAMDLRLPHRIISNFLRDVDRFGTCTKDSQKRIARDSRRGRRVPLRCTRADCSWEASSSVCPVSLWHSRISNVLKDTRPWNNFSGQ